MKAKILITTAPGEARKNEWVLRKVLAGVRKFRSFEMFISKKDDMIIWEIEDEARRVMKIYKNTNKYDVLIKAAMQSWAVRKMANRLSNEDRKVWEKMLTEDTKVEIIKEATAEELVDVNKTFWQRLKEKFKRADPGLHSPGKPPPQT